MILNPWKLNVLVSNIKWISELIQNQSKPNKGFQKHTMITIFISEDNGESTTAKYGDVEEGNETKDNTGIIVGIIVIIIILTLALALFFLLKQRKICFSTAASERNLKLTGTDFKSL